MSSAWGTSDCDRCGAGIVNDGYARPRRMHLDLVVGTDTDQRIETVRRGLCSECEQELVEWVDEGEVSREGKVDLPSRVASGMSLRRTAEELESLADEVESALAPESGETDDE